MIKFTVLTLFPNMFSEFAKSSIICKAIDKKLIEINVVDLREFGKGKRKNVDDTVYGGGIGMVITVPVLDEALNSIVGNEPGEFKIIYLSPKGKVLTQKKAINMAMNNNIQYILICGHYEGVDNRIFSLYDIEEISIGDYVLTGGEIPAMTIIDTVTRLVDGVLKKDATINESHYLSKLLEEPQYTKPEDYKGKKVPSVLLSGNHQEIEKYRYENSIYETYKKRPDLLELYTKENNNAQEYVNKIIEEGGK